MQSGFADENCKSHGSVKSDGVNGKGNPREADTHSDEKKSKSEEAPEVSLSTDVIKKQAIEMREAKSWVIYKTVRDPGDFFLNEDKVAHVSPKAPGVTVNFFKSLGDKVYDGDILAIF